MEGSGRICTITGFPDLVGAAEAPGEPANGDTATGGCGLPVGCERSRHCLPLGWDRAPNCHNFEGLPGHPAPPIPLGLRRIGLRGKARSPPASARQNQDDRPNSPTRSHLR